MIVGKNDTNAFDASATLRSMNSFSSMRSHTCQKIVRSTQLRVRRGLAATRHQRLGAFLVRAHGTTRLNETRLTLTWKLNAGPSVGVTRFG